MIIHARPLVVGLAIAGTLGLGLAAPAEAAPIVYHSAAACQAAGRALVSSGQWSGYMCVSMLGPTGKPMFLFILQPDDN